MPIIERVMQGTPQTNIDLQIAIPPSPGFNKIMYRPQNHSLGEAQYEEDNMVMQEQRFKMFGLAVSISRVLRGIKIKRVNYELNLPEGYNAIPEIRDAAGNDCTYDFILVDPCRKGFFRLVNATMDEVRRRGTPIESPRNELAPLTYYTTIRGYEVEYYQLKGRKSNSALGYNPYAISYVFPQCQECNVLAHQKGVVGGLLEGTPDVTQNEFTENRWATNTNVTGAATSTTTQYIMNYENRLGSSLFSVSTDTLIEASAVAGSVGRSPDGGKNWSTIATAAEGLFAIVFGVKYLWVFGTAGYVARSANLSTFTQIVNTVMATTHIMDSAYDPISGDIYFVGHDGTDGKFGKISGETITDLTSLVPSLTGKKLYSIKVLSGLLDDKTHIAIGGASGYYAENTDVNGVGVWASDSVGTASTIRAIEGDSYRVMVGAGNAIYERSPNNDLNFLDTEVDFVGNVQNGATGITLKGANHIAFVTINGATDGEVITFAPVEVET